MEVEQKVLSILEREDIDYQRSTHREVRTSKQASEVRDVPLDTGVKAMVLKRSDGELLLGLVPADRRVDLEEISRKEGREVKLADPDEVLETVGCKVGGVHPFGHRDPLKTYLDPKILQKGRINFNAGKRYISVDIRSTDLRSCIEASGADLKIVEIKK